MQIRLSNSCKECNGYTYYTDEGNEAICPECNGIGYIPTESGKDLLEFLNLFYIKAKSDK